MYEIKAIYFFVVDETSH